MKSHKVATLLCYWRAPYDYRLARVFVRQESGTLFAKSKTVLIERYVGAL